MEKITEKLNYEEVATVEKSYKYSAIIFESDLLRFKFDVAQFEPETVYKIRFIDLMPLYHEYYYKYSEEFRKLHLKWFEVVKIQTYDETFLLLLTNEEHRFKALLELSHMKSLKYKANFTKGERSLIYKLKNYSFKGGVNSYWSIEEQIIIEQMEYEVKMKRLLFGVLSRQENFDKNIKLYHQGVLPPFKVEVIEYLIDLREEISVLTEALEEKVLNYNHYLDCFSDETTVIDDYDLYKYCIE